MNSAFVGYEELSKSRSTLTFNAIPIDLYTYLYISTVLLLFMLTLLYDLYDLKESLVR